MRTHAPVVQLVTSARATQRGIITLEGLRMKLEDAPTILTV